MSYRTSTLAGPRGCEVLNDTSVNGSWSWPVMVTFAYAACVCNKRADETHPGMCDIVCPRNNSFMDGCFCTNHLKAGSACDEEVCQLGGKTFCSAWYLAFMASLKWQCDKMVNYERLSEIPYCSCGSGKISNGKCSCNQYYSGTFCETYQPPQVQFVITTTPRK